MKNKTLQKSITVAENLIGYLVIIAICLVTFGVFARMLNVPVAWTDELLRAIFIWLIFIASAVAFKTGDLIGLDLIEEMVSKKPVATKLLKFSQAVGAAVFSCFMVLQTYRIVSTQFASSETTPVLGMTLWFINLGYLIGSCMFLIFTIQKFIQLFAPAKKAES